MADKNLTFGLLTKGADKAAGDFLKVGRAAAASSDDVLGLARRLDDISRKSATARVKLAGDKEAQASLDKLNLKLLEAGRKVTPDISIEGAAKASAEISALDVELDRLGKKGGSADIAAKAVGSSSGGLASPTGMGALVAAGVVLSPVIATLGTGLAGFGLAAYGAAKPIEAAAQKTGGLSANMKLLDPEQQAVARGLLGLGKQYDVFQKALQPQVLGVFNQGLKLAGGLMKDVEPVAAATGSALADLLGSVGKEFQSGQWQQFFGFMARTAGPDLQLVGDNFTGLLNLLPPLLEQLQPLARSFLILTTDVISAGDALVAAADKGEHFITWAQHAANTGAQNNSVWHGVWTVIRGITDFLPTGQSSFLRFAGGINAASLAQDKVTTAAQAYLALPFVRQLGADTAAVQALTAAQQNALTVQLAYGSDLVTTANDAQALHDKLKLSAGQIGLHTQAQRDSFAAANTYIGDLAKTATDAVSSGHGVDAAIRAISQGLPVLDSAKTKNRAYWEEVATLVGWLDRLRQEKAISEAIHVSGSGVWSVTPGKIGLPGGTAGGPFAAGGMVTGGIPGRDSVLIRAMPGEAVVPRSLTPAVAPFLKAHQVPGFAAGGVVGSYAGNVAGLAPWTRGELLATQSAIGRSVAQALVGGIKSAFTGGFPPGPTGGAQFALERYAASLFPRYGWSGGQILPLGALWTRESGWNRFARNASSGAYGIAQALPPTKYPFAGQAAGGSSAAAQIAWGENYIAGRYGTPAGAWAHEQAFNWYGKGLNAIFRRPALIGVGERGAEHVSVTPVRSPSQPVKVVLEVRTTGTTDLDRALTTWLCKSVVTRGGGDVQSAFGAA